MSYKIYGDWHHGALGRSLFLTLQDRLGHQLSFPDGSFAAEVNAPRVGTWLTPNHEADGGYDGGVPRVISRQQFLDEDWDAVIISRAESEPIFRDLLSKHPKGNKIKRIGQAGNEGQRYDWDFCPNFLSSDYLSFLVSGAANKIWYFQEVGRQFQDTPFVYLTEDNLKRIHTYINCLASFRDWHWDKDASWWNATCPHCDSPGPATGPTVHVADIWSNMVTHLPDHQLLDYGINNTQGVTIERNLPDTITQASLTFAAKTHEGYGHSIANSVSMGRMCLVPRRFHRYRTANSFLIPNVTCLEVEWNAESCINTIRWFTESLERANVYSEACHKAANAIFDWPKEAFRVSEFMEKLA